MGQQLKRQKKKKAFTEEGPLRPVKVNCAKSLLLRELKASYCCTARASPPADAPHAEAAVWLEAGEEGCGGGQAGTPSPSACALGATPPPGDQRLPRPQSGQGHHLPLVRRGPELCQPESTGSHAAEATVQTGREQLLNERWVAGGEEAKAGPSWSGPSSEEGRLRRGQQLDTG